MDIWLTGCTSGLGRALVPEFVDRGHRVVGCGRNEAALDELTSAYPEHHWAQVDVTDDGAVAAFAREALDRVGPPQLLINNAGVINNPASLWEVTAAEFDVVMKVNVSGVANVIRHVLPSMLAIGTGVVANLSSGWGRSTAPEVAPYCASKWAIEGLTSALAQELPSGLAAVAVSPGIVATEMLRQCWPDTADNFPTPASWATTAAPFFLGLDPSYNGQSVSTP